MTLPNLVLRAVLFCAVLAAPLFAQTTQTTPKRSERLQQSELKQQQLQRTTQRVGEQLSGVITEFERNGIAGEDVTVLRAIRMVLGRLGDKEMAQVITLLQQAQQGPDDNAARKTVTEAYSGQKTIITQLKQLLLEYQRQQALYEMSIMLRGLAARQSANMRVGVWLARQTEQRPFANFGEDEKRYLQQQEIDEIAIKDEVALVLKKLEKLASETDGTATGERPKAALDQAKSGGLTTALEAAAADLKAAKLLSATGNEKKARDQMRDVARTLLLSKDLVELLRAAIQETENAVLQQKAVIEVTRKIERKEDARDVEDKQFEVVDDTDLIRRDINDVAPTAASYFRGAIDKMQEARALLNESKDPKSKSKATPPKQTDAVTNLELAKRALLDQLALAEKEAEKPENVLANLRELQKEVQELIKREENLKQDAAALQKPEEFKAQAPVQGEIRDKTQEVQQKAANDAPDAAQSLNEAADQMEASQKDLARSKNSPEAQQAAIESLKKAADELAKQIAKLEAAEKQFASLEELLEKLRKVIEDEQKLRLDTAKEAVKPTPAPLKDIAAKQQQVGNETGELQKEAVEPAPTAAQHLGEAKKEMSDAKSQLDKPDANAAQPPQTKALKELYAAKKDLESKINELKKELGLPLDNLSQLADAAAAIEKAQREVNESMEQMANMPPGFLDMLQKQQQQIADALAETAKSSPSPNVSQAQQAAAKAAQQLSESRLKNAVASMEQAESGIKNAQSGQQPQPKNAEPSLPQLGQQQADVKKMTEQLLAAQEGTPAQAMQAAADLLEQALNDVAPVAAGQAGPLPAAAQQAVQSAQSSLTQAAAQAGGKQSGPAQQNAAAAADALAQAQAALALAQAGLGAEMAGQGQQPGQGQGQGQGKGKGQGQGNQPGQGQGQGTPPPRGNGDQGNFTGTGGANGARSGTSGTGTFVGLPKRDRAAIQQSQAEKYPQEYGPLVEQYLKNLSDQAEK